MMNLFVADSYYANHYPFIIDWLKTQPCWRQIKRTIIVYEIVQIFVQYMSFLPNQLLAGRILAISGLALAPFTTSLGNHYSRTLYFSQFLFLFSFIYNTTTEVSFSAHLDYSYLTFMPSFTSTSWGDFSYDFGFLVSPAICWLGGVILLFLLVKLLACKFENLTFCKPYSFYRGFFYWFFVPLTYLSTSRLIYGIQANDLTKSWVTAIIILSGFVLIVLVELSATKCIQRQQQNKWRKWIYFFCHLQVASMAVLLAIYQYCPNADVTKYLLNIPLVLYAIIFLYEYKFMYRVGERISVFIQDAIIITVYNIFAIKYSYITQYGLDFFGLVIVAVLELLFLLPKVIKACRREQSDSNSIIYAQNAQNDQPRESTKNHMANGEMYVADQSYQGLKYNPNPFTNAPKLRPAHLT